MRRASSNPAQPTADPTLRPARSLRKKLVNVMAKAPPPPPPLTRDGGGGSNRNRGQMALSPSSTVAGVRAITPEALPLAPLALNLRTLTRSHRAEYEPNPKSPTHRDKLLPASPIKGGVGDAEGAEGFGGVGDLGIPSPRAEANFSPDDGEGANPGVYTQQQLEITPVDLVSDVQEMLKAVRRGVMSLLGQAEAMASDVQVRDLIKNKLWEHSCGV